MKVINFTLNINIDQTQPQSGCFGIYYELFSSKRCVEDPNIADAVGNQIPGDAVKNVTLLQSGYIDCVTFNSTDTVVTYNGSISYNDNNTFDYLSCRTFIKFYVLPCCVNNWNCGTLPTNINDPSTYHDIIINSVEHPKDLSSQVNKTLCRRYLIALDSTVTYSYPITIQYKDCGQANNYYCPNTVGGNPDPNALISQNRSITLTSAFGTVTGSIPSGNLGRVVEICAFETPIVVDSTNTIINDLVLGVEDINESKEPITGDCCSKCRTYQIINNGTSPITYQYQNCDGSYTIVNNLAPGACVCIRAIQGTVRAGNVGQNIIVNDFGWHGAISNCVASCGN
jgi:hypothetical protein